MGRPPSVSPPLWQLPLPLPSSLLATVSLEVLLTLLSPLLLLSPLPLLSPLLLLLLLLSLGAGQVSHQSVHKPLQGENRGVTQSKAFGSPVAAVADHPSTTHGVGANRVGPALVSTGVVGHSVVAPVAHGVSHGVVGHG